MIEARGLNRFAFVLCLALTTACAGKRPLPGETACELPPSPKAVIVTLDEFGPGVTALSNRDLAAMARSAKTRPLRYLALSGGGEDGAYGAGFLKGWAGADEPGDELPEFDIVTGVSTGALISTFAFLGDPGPLSIYTEVDDSTLTSRRPLPFAIFSDSLFKNGKLREKVRGIITKEVLLDVAARADTATLRVGAVNLDTNQFQQFDLGQIAINFEKAHKADNDQAADTWHEIYIEAVVASTAIPLVFPPSYLNCNMYVDGGARQQIFLEQAIADLKAARKRQMQVFRDSTARGEPPGGPEIYAVVNGQPALLFDGPADNTLAGIGGRSVRTLLNANLQNDIRNICDIETDLPVQLTDIGQLPRPAIDRCEAKRESGKLFSQGYMQCLYEAAAELWQAPATDAMPWKACASRPM